MKRDPGCIYGPTDIKDFLNSLEGNFKTRQENINAEKELFFRNFVKN